MTVTTPVRGRGDSVPEKLVEALDRLARARRAHCQHVATTQELSPLQADLVTTLHDGPPPEPVVGRLARELAVAQPTVTDSLRTLEGKGLLSRAQDPASRRQTLVQLTPAGTALADQLVDADHALFGAVAELETAHQERILEGLLDLIASFVDARVIDVARTCTTCRHHQLRSDSSHHCSLLDATLSSSELRVNCAEHAAMTPTGPR